MFSELICYQNRNSSKVNFTPKNSLVTLGNASKVRTLYTHPGEGGVNDSLLIP